mgnify:CR=1 FL=1
MGENNDSLSKRVVLKANFCNISAIINGMSETTAYRYSWDSGSLGTYTNAEENNSQNQCGILFPIAGEVSDTEEYLISLIKTEGKEKNYEFIDRADGNASSAI